MSTFVTRVAGSVLLLGLSVAPGFADNPPRLNVSPSCDAAARGAIVLGRDKAACLSDEKTALDTIGKNWSKYSGDDKTQCVGMVRTGGAASYVELLSCLEMMRDAKVIRNTDPLVGDNGTQNSTQGQISRRRRQAY